MKVIDNFFRNKMGIHRNSLIYFIYDFVIVVFSVFLAFMVEAGMDYAVFLRILSIHTRLFYITYVVIILLCFAILHMYSILWEYAEIMEMLRITAAVGLGVTLGTLYHHILKDYEPLSYYITQFFFLFALAIWVRYAKRIRSAKLKLSLSQLINRTKVHKGNKSILFGAGEAGRMILKEIQESDHIQKRVLCVLDDDKGKWGSYIGGIQVMGGRESLEKCVKKYGIEEIIIAIPTLKPQERKKLIEACQETDCEISILPGVFQLINKEVNTTKLRKVNVEDLLGRDPIESNLASIMGYIGGKVVMVTGGGGSIGSELCRQIAGYQPKQLIILDNYENNAYNLQMELKRHYPELDLRVIIANVQDRQRMFQIFGTYHPQVVYHAAAHKHVPLMEHSPCESIKNNVFGTFNVAGAADAHGVERFVMISTDKAVRPTNIMGASKRICEMIIQLYNNHSATEFVAVRFGNVLGSNGSVVPLFKKQIEEGGPVTVTHPNIIRYFMTIPEAVSLVLEAGAYAKGGEFFILDMGEPVRIVDMARNLIRLSGYRPDVDIKIEFTGLRPGEKLYEELLMDEEKTETENKRIFVGKSLPLDENFVRQQLDALKEAAYQNDEEHIRELVKGLVPEYRCVP